MKTIYQSTFIASGSNAAESLDDNFIITFGEGVPDEIAEYCFIHQPEQMLLETLLPGAILSIGDHSWPITAVGDVAEINLRELGHVTVKFDGAKQADCPGTIHVEGAVPIAITSGQKFRILTNN